MRTSGLDPLRERRVPLLAALDSVAWLGATYVATAFRLDTWTLAPVLHLQDSAGRLPGGGVFLVGAAAGLLHCLLARVVRLHQGRSTTGSFEELVSLGAVISTVAVVATVANAALDPSPLPRVVPLLAGVLALFLSAWPRALWRQATDASRDWRDRRERGRGAPAPAATPVLIVGAGEAGQQLIASMQQDRTWRPVGMVDDDPRKRHFRSRGVPVIGTVHELGDLAVRAGVGTVVIAIPSAPSDTLLRINRLARGADLDVKVLPGVRELMGSLVDQSEVRDISPEDLLGRHQVHTSLESVRGFLRGRRVLVTGAGGSIGAELCHQIDELGPAELVLLDRDESALHALLLRIRRRADLGSSEVVLADVRDAERIRAVFADRRPEVVFHAAALKHVNALEAHAGEAVKTNVIGTLNVLTAAREAGVTRFVNISTDKAADPTTVLGHTKRIAERLTSSFSTTTDGTYLSVRFGNVLGTRGSVLETFGQQIRSGGPVTVTDPGATRYFMTVDEAVQLVIQAAALGDDGEALVLDMGAPVRILDVARHLVDQARQPVPIVFTGLRSGEKLHEVLFGTGEDDLRPEHPMISHVTVPPLPPRLVATLPLGADQDLTARCVARMSAAQGVLTRVVAT